MQLQALITRLALLLWISLFVKLNMAANQVQSINVTIVRGYAGAVSFEIPFTLWYNSQIYQFTYPKDTIGSYSTTELTVHCPIDQSFCPAEACIMIENIMNGNNAILIDEIRFWISPDTWYGISGRCVDDELLGLQPWLSDDYYDAYLENYSGCVTGESNTWICIDDDTDQCQPRKQILYFDMTRPNEYILDASWTDGTDVFPQTHTCDPATVPSKEPTRSPSTPPSNLPSYSPSPLPTIPPTTFPSWLASTDTTFVSINTSKMTTPFPTSYLTFNTPTSSPIATTSTINTLWINTTNIFKVQRDSDNGSTKAHNSDNVLLIVFICVSVLIVVTTCIVIVLCLKIFKPKKEAQTAVNKHLREVQIAVVEYQVSVENKNKIAKRKTSRGNDDDIIINDDEFVVRSDSESNSMKHVSSGKTQRDEPNDVEGEKQRRGPNVLVEGNEGRMDNVLHEDNAEQAGKIWNDITTKETIRPTNTFYNSQSKQ